MNELLSDMLERLGAVEDQGGRLDLLESLIAQVPNKELYGEAVFRKSLMELGRELEEMDGSQRIRALALLLKIQKGPEDIKAIAKLQLKGLLTKPPGSLHILASEKERNWVLTALSKVQSGWTVEYFSSQVRSPELSAAIRAKLVAAVIAQSESWSGAIRALTPSLMQSVEDEIPTDMFDRSLHVLGAIRNSLSSSSLPPGEQFGESLWHISESAFSSGAVRDPKGSMPKVVAEALHVLDIATACRPLLLEDATVLEACNRMKVALQGRPWPATSARYLGRMGQRVADTILLFARRGIVREDCFMLLSVLRGGDAAAHRTLKVAAEREMHLSEWIVGWLGEGTLPESHALQLTQSDDQHLANLILRSAELSRVLAEVDRGLESEKGSLAGHIENVLTEVESLGRRRGLELNGSVGEVVDFQQAIHRIAGESRAKPEKVRLLVPAVIRRFGTGRFEVITKAITEFAE